MHDTQLERATTTLRQLRDAMLAIANAGADMPPQAIRSVASLAARAADEALVELKP